VARFYSQTFTLAANSSQYIDLGGEFIQFLSISGGVGDGTIGVQFDQEPYIPVYGRDTYTLKFRNCSVVNYSATTPVTVTILVGRGAPPVQPPRDTQSTVLKVTQLVFTAGQVRQLVAANPLRRRVGVISTVGAWYWGPDNTVGSATGFFASGATEKWYEHCAALWGYSSSAQTITVAEERYI